MEPCENVEQLKPSNLRTRTELVTKVMNILAEASPEDRIAVIQAASVLCMDELMRQRTDEPRGFMIPRFPCP